MSILYSMLRKEIMKLIRQVYRHFHCRIQWCICIFVDHSRWGFTSCWRKGNYGEMAAVLTQNGIAKGLSMQIQEKNGMTLLSQGSWFWLLRREVNFKSSLHRMAKARCTATLWKGRRPFQGNGLLSWLMTAYATMFVEYQITDKNDSYNITLIHNENIKVKKK